ncbi:MAG TPA: hypothetical protein VKS82_15110 [Streptosporangiaceae bacterium]|nr:hypothetical protein [Streptosporangiaceae bacterium]
MDGQTGPRWDLLLVVTSDQYGSVRFGTVRRLIDTALRSGHSIQVWACGEANGLTELGPAGAGHSPGEGSPAAGSRSRGGKRPAAEQIGALAAGNVGRFTWLACQTCSGERGAGEHVPGLPTPSFSDLRDYVAQAAKTVFIGGA